MKSLLYEKVQLNLPDCLLMEWDGRFVLKSLRRITKQERLLNNYIVSIRKDNLFYKKSQWKYFIFRVQEWS